MEQINKLTYQEIVDLFLFSSFNERPIEIYDMLKDKEFNLVPFFKKLKDHSVIELGPGISPVVIDFPCKTYKGVQPHDHPIQEINGEIIIQDALSYLRHSEVKDSSSVILSFGLLDNLVLRIYDQRFSPQLMKYRDELAYEIKRVMDPFAIVVGNIAEDLLGVPDIPFTNGTRILQGGVYFNR